MRLCGAVRILGCLSKGVICVGIPGRKRFDVDLLNSTLLKTGVLFVPNEAVLLSHFVLVGGVTLFVGVREKEEKRCISISD